MKSGLVQAGLVVSGEGSDPCKCKLPYTTLTLHQLWTALVIIIIIIAIIIVIIQLNAQYPRRNLFTG